MSLWNHAQFCDVLCPCKDSLFFSAQKKHHRLKADLPRIDPSPRHLSIILQRNIMDLWPQTHYLQGIWGRGGSNHFSQVMIVTFAMWMNHWSRGRLSPTTRCSDRKSVLSWTTKATSTQNTKCGLLAGRQLDCLRERKLCSGQRPQAQILTHSLPTTTQTRIKYSIYLIMQLKPMLRRDVNCTVNNLALPLTRTVQTSTWSKSIIQIHRYPELFLGMLPMVASNL